MNFRRTLRIILSMLPLILLGGSSDQAFNKENSIEPISEPKPIIKNAPAHVNEIYQMFPDLVVTEAGDLEALEARLVREVESRANLETIQISIGSSQLGGITAFANEGNENKVDGVDSDIITNWDYQGASSMEEAINGLEPYYAHMEFVGETEGGEECHQSAFIGYLNDNDKIDFSTNTTIETANGHIISQLNINGEITPAQREDKGEVILAPEYACNFGFESEPGMK